MVRVVVVDSVDLLVSCFMVGYIVRMLQNNSINTEANNDSKENFVYISKSVLVAEASLFVVVA
jgi:hypothetical protein